MMEVVSIEGNGARPSHKGVGWSVGGAMYTLNSTEVHCVCYSIGSVNSKAWLDGNPNTGCYVTETARTLDAITCGNPAYNQGGIAVVEIHGADLYNHTLTGDVSMTLCCERADPHHIPCVIGDV